MLKKPIVLMVVEDRFHEVGTNTDREVLSFILRRLYQCEVKVHKYWGEAATKYSKDRVIGAVVNQNGSWQIESIRSVYSDIPIIILRDYDLTEIPKELSQPGVVMLEVQKEEVQNTIDEWVKSYLKDELPEEEEQKTTPEYRAELARWLALTPRERQNIFDSQVDGRFSMGNNVAGFAVCDQTMERHITDGFGLHQYCIRVVYDRFEEIICFPNGAKALLGKEGEYNGQIFFGFLLSKVKEFSFPPLIIFDEPGETERLDRLIEKLRKEGQYLVSAKKDCLVFDD